MSLKNIMFGKASAGKTYSDIVVVDGRQLFLSGLISQNLDTQAVCYGTIVEETRTILENLAKILIEHGSDMDHIVRIDIALADFSLRDEMNAEYMRHFHPAHLPARFCYGNVGLHEKCKIEITVIAVKR